MKKLSTKQFVSKAILCHGHKYNYSDVIYDGANKKIKIICYAHGVFFQLPSSHLQGRTCPRCSYEIRGQKLASTKSEFIAKANVIHGNKYDYSKVNYTRNRYKVVIICKKHGIFLQTANSHLNGEGCSSCAIVDASLTPNDFLNKAVKIHGNKYDYSKSVYEGIETPLEIICSKHGPFWQPPHTHLRNHGCSKCKAEANGNRFRSNKQEFIRLARKFMEINMTIPNQFIKQVETN